MKFCTLSIIPLLLFGTTLAHGAVINVGAGQSIQTAIDNANAGDTIHLIAPGDYLGDLNITKPLKIISSHPDNHNIFGNVSVSGLPTGQSLNLKNLTLVGGIFASNSSLNIVRCYLSKDVNATNPGGLDTQLTIVQSTLSGKLSSSLSRTWIGYSDLRQSYFEGKLEIVGNIFNGNGTGGIGLDIKGNHTFANIHNNIIHNFKSDNGGWSETCIGIRIDNGARLKILNNRINHNTNGSDRANRLHHTGIGILIKNTQSCLVYGNTFYENKVDWGQDVQGAKKGSLHIYSISENVLLRFNAFKEHVNNSIKPIAVFGAEPLESITDTALNSGFLSNTTALANGRMSKTAGNPSVLFNDHDGSRNDIGPNGGRNYIPNGRTTDKPIPILFTIEPQIVPSNGTVTIESTGATVK
jgi:hypothetical protein